MATEITTWSELAAINSGLSGDYILMNDLGSGDTGYDTYASSTANGDAGWLPLGQSSPFFTGTFEGNGFIISDININRGGQSRIGLFGEITGTGVVSNMGVNNISLIGGSNCGGFSGRITSGGLINNCYSNGTVLADGFGAGAGGLIGTTFNPINITNCYSNVDVECSSGNSKAGGLVGNAQSSAIINKCYSTGTSSATTEGGLMGVSSGTVTNSFWDTQTSGQASSDGGTGKTTAQMKDFDTFNNASWDIALIGNFTSEIWFIDDGNDYPRLGWEFVVEGVTRKIKISGTFVEKPILTKVGGTFVDKPIKIKVGGTFQDA